MARERAEALVVQPLFANNLGLGPQVAELATRQRMATISDGAGFAEQGGLIFYGPDAIAIYERIASFVDRILKGGNPAEMPVEQPQKFELILNQTTAKRVGIAFPQALRVQANRVIE